MKKVLITGGTGCIGAAAVHVLADRGVDEILVASRSGSPGILKLWFGDKLDPRVTMIRGDVSETETVRYWIEAYQPTHIIHLGAFQTPDCDAEPWRGMEINVGGTMELLNAVAKHGKNVERFVFASSGAVYGRRSLYPGLTVKETDPLAPPNYYGVWKVAGEHLCRLFHEKTGIPTVCLRLNTTYGKGRDAGKTSAVTTAMKSIAYGHVKGEKIPFRMPYYGKENYHYVLDVGTHFAACAVEPFSGFGAFNILGKTVEVAEFLALIKITAADLGMTEAVDLDFAPDAAEALFVYDLDDESIQKSFPDMPRTPLDIGIRLALESFREMTEAGTLKMPA